MGRRLATPCVHDLWVPDGMKDACVDRLGFRQRLLESLDAIYADAYDRSALLDAVESKLFGIGSESFVVGSHELYLGYCQARRLMPCLDMGHYHPTESVADKISALLPFHESLLVHVSRGVRWDSDHVPLLDDSLRDLTAEVFRCAATGRVRLALDFFDASVHRVAAWVVAGRALRQALLLAALEPYAILRQMEADGDYTGRLALLEHVRSLPWGVVWDEFCSRHDVPTGLDWLEAARAHRGAV
jgi:L-rhamnose isomerase